MSVDTDTRCDLFIARHFNAAPEKVFKCFTTIDGLKQWMGPQTCRVLDGEMDFRVGGTYKLRMSTAMGDVSLKGVFEEIDAPRTLAYTFQWCDNEVFNSIETRVSFSFQEEGGGTLMHMHHKGLENPESRDNHHEGWNGSFDKLFLQMVMFETGRISWNELASRDPAGSKQFYQDLLGWGSMDMPVTAEQNYTMFTREHQPVAGLVTITPECGDGNVPTCWSSYINVEDVEASLAKAESLGATTVMPVTAVGEMGKMAFITDPQGASIALWESLC